VGRVRYGANGDGPTTAYGAKRSLRCVQSDGENLLSLSFSPAELDKILVQPADLEVREIETGLVLDEFWISIRGPLTRQANALKALQDGMKPFAGVTVEQGTINLG